MSSLTLFCILSIPIIFLSWRSLSNLKSHGFYRFFGWECIVWLLASNYKFWFNDPLGIKQVISWVLLFISIYYVIAGFVLLKKFGKAENMEGRESLYRFEKTTKLVKNGIFRLIRHPLYGSLIFLGWGIYLKNTTIPLLPVTFGSTIFLYLTALREERECLEYFGDIYREYMKHTKMFVPFLL
jgi:protein-S-isoprenylcysteine O-methyltransferase Ste14